jgi:hypothetical protein
MALSIAGMTKRCLKCIISPKEPGGKFSVTIAVGKFN